jgi:hypothetical protein
MLTRHLALVGFLVVLAVSLGCYSKPMEENWGTAYDLTKEAQVLDPEAGQTADPVTGFDGVAASNDMKKYRKSFSKEQKTSAQEDKFGIFLGTGSGGGASGT